MRQIRRLDCVISERYLKGDDSVKGDELNRMIKLYHQTVYRAAYSLPQNAAEADDVTQETFIKLFNTEKRFESDEHCKAWLIRAAINLSKSRLKSFGIYSHGGAERNDEGKWSERDDKAVFSNFIPIGGLGSCGGSAKLELSHIYKKEWHGTDSEVIYTDIDLELPVTSDMSKFNKEIKLDSAADASLGEWGEWSYDALEITPLGVSFVLHTDEPVDFEIFKKYRPQIPVKVNFKDGSTLNVSDSLSLGYDGEKELGLYKTFNNPINVDDVKSVRFMDEVVDMNGKDT